MIIANNKTIKEKTIELIDALKSTCQTYGMGNDGNEYLRAFDFLADTFNRCERNFALSTKWDELTAPVVESF